MDRCVPGRVNDNKEKVRGGENLGRQHETRTTFNDDRAKPEHTKRSHICGFGVIERKKGFFFAFHPPCSDQWVRNQCSVYEHRCYFNGL